LHSNDMDLLAEGLHESNSELVHDASWAVPEVDPDTLIAARTKLRRDKNTSTGQRTCTLKLVPIESSTVAQRFQFNPNPEVNQQDPNS